ncbi:hypothetical protein [Sphingomonas sp. QA11]|uniref:hypothetical protein n=1 Tax=Sphingomonas sp. QA11 TaxID=2950605 RepID=UPI00300E6127
MLATFSIWGLVSRRIDQIGRDVLVQWPGSMNMQFYWHTTKPSYAPLATIPENRLYLTADAADSFVAGWIAFSHGRIVTDDRTAPAIEIGRPGKTCRRIRLNSGYGEMVVLVSNGAPPMALWPRVDRLRSHRSARDARQATAAGAETLVPAYAGQDRASAMVRFPGGYIAEIHAASH